MTSQQHIDKENQNNADNFVADEAYDKAEQQQNIGMRALAGLFLLEQKFRRVGDSTQLAQLLVNRLNRFAPYDCALFWLCDASGQVFYITISGLSPAETNHPIMRWGESVAIWLSQSNWGNMQITPKLIDGAHRVKIWPHNIPKAGLYVPIWAANGRLRGGILLLRQSGWSPPVRVMLDQIADAAAYTLDALAAGVHGAHAQHPRAQHPYSLNPSDGYPSEGGGNRLRRLVLIMVLLIGVLAAAFFAPQPNIMADVMANMPMADVVPETLQNMLPEMLRERVETLRLLYFE